MRSLAAIACALVLCAPPSRAAASTSLAPDPCSLVTKDDAFRLLGWTLEGRARKRYAIAGATGTICFLDSPQGKIIVTVPDRGADFIGATPYSDSGAASMSRHVYGLGGDVMLYNGTAYVTRYKRSVSVHVVPNENPASYDDVEGFAKTVLSHLR
ncbi:MAG: hypothetical protein NVS2B3_08450 [Vulcanimicrobiaceae bacterium]